MRLVIKGNGAPAPRADSALLKAVAQHINGLRICWRVARNQWRRLLNASASAAATSDDCCGWRWPVIVEAIAAGDQPLELTAEALAEQIDLPVLWTAQAKAVGIAS